MQKIKYNRDSILIDLREGSCKIFYMNQNNQRVGLRCSLKPDLLPDSYYLTEEPKEREFHAKNPEIISVWDLDNGGWKQFHIDSIQYVESVDTF